MITRGVVEVQGVPTLGRIWLQAYTSMKSEADIVCQELSFKCKTKFTIVQFVPATLGNSLTHSGPRSNLTWSMSFTFGEQPVAPDVRRLGEYIQRIQIFLPPDFDNRMKPRVSLPRFDKIVNNFYSILNNKK